MEQGHQGWVDDGKWERVVVVPPGRVVCRRPSTSKIPPRVKRSIPPRVKRRPATIPSRVKRRVPLAA